MTEEKSMLRCTVRKFVSVTHKALKWGSITGVFILVIGAMGWIGWSIRDQISAGWQTFVSVCAGAVGLILGPIAAVPWYAWVVLAIPCAMLGYSFLWCVARELRDEDWKSDIAANVAVFNCVTLTIGISVSCVSIGRFFVSNLSPKIGEPLGMIAPGIGILFILAGVASCGVVPWWVDHSVDDPTSSCSRILYFLGAWWNSRKRMKDNH